MKEMRKRRAWSALMSLCLIAAVLTAQSDVAHAGTGLNQFGWGDPNITLSVTSYKYSNMSGFWQAVLNSNGCVVVLDGIFGSTTAWYTSAFQNSLFATNNGGIMTPAWLNYFQNATSVYGGRLIDKNYVDGYGTRHYSYYGGFDSAVELGWSPFSAQWMFSQTPASNPNALVAATPNRSIGSVAACA